MGSQNLMVETIPLRAKIIPDVRAATAFCGAKARRSLPPGRPGAVIGREDYPLRFVSRSQVGMGYDSIQPPDSSQVPIWPEGSIGFVTK